LYQSLLKPLFQSLCLAPRVLLDWFFERPYAASMWSAGAIAVVGGLICVYLAVAVERPKEPTVLETAFTALDDGDMTQASTIAQAKLAEPGLTGELRSACSYILGAAAIHDAEASFSPEDKRKLSLLAARYLEESRYLGFPSGRHHTGFLLYGKSLHDAGRYAQSLPPLTEAMLLNPDKETEIAGLLADAYYRDKPPQTGPALKYSEQYLSDTTLTPNQRAVALLLQSEILLAANDLAACNATLQKIKDDAPFQAEKLVVAARLLIAEANAAGASAAEDNLQKYEQAATKLTSSMKTEGASGESVANASYLLGVVKSYQGDKAAAEEQFRRTRQNNYGKPAAVAAGLQEAAAQLAQGLDENALKTLLAILSEATESDLFENEWVPLGELRQQIKNAQRSMLTSGSFPQALKLVEGASRMFPPDEIVEMKAVTHAEWGSQLLAAAAQQSSGAAAQDPAAKDAADKKVSEGRAHMRKSGNLYAELASLRPASRDYHGILWNSAQGYIEGHDFKNAARQLDTYLLDQEISGRPKAMVALGRVRISMNQIDSAIEVLELCIDLHPRHPLSYQARLLAAGALLEKNLPARARELLDENMHQGALTPRSLEWRDSLFKLGEIYHREGSNLEATSRQQGVDSGDEDTVKAALVTLEQAQKKFHEAASTFDEAVRRYPLAPQGLRARHLMAESHRYAARYPRKRLPLVSIATTRVELTRQLQEDLQIAVNVYDSLLKELAFATQDSSGQGFAAAILRNSYFGKADALFDLDRFEEAIVAYSSATSKYHDEPVAIEAFAQIARCYRELGRTAEARGTLEQAKVVLKRIPDDVDFAATTRYDREQWVRFLDWMTKQ